MNQQSYVAFGWLIAVSSAAVIPVYDCGRFWRTKKCIGICLLLVGLYLMLVQGFHVWPYPSE